MLIAINNDKKILASDANKENVYTCPSCLESVILKKGRIVIHHFSHRPESTCDYGSGESQLHLKTKLEIYNHLKNKNVQNLEMEKFLGSSRPDVYFEYNGLKIAIEVQISSLTLDIIEKRTQLYHENEIYVFWVLPIDEVNKQIKNNRLILKSWQKFIYGLYYGIIYCWDINAVRPVYLKAAKTWVPEFDIYGGYYKTLKKTKDVIMGNNVFDLPDDFSCKNRGSYVSIPAANIFTPMNTEERFKRLREASHEHDWEFIENGPFSTYFLCKICHKDYDKRTMELLYNMNIDRELYDEKIKLFSKLFPNIIFDIEKQVLCENQI